MHESDECGVDHLCSGLRGGIDCGERDAGVHSGECYGVLMADAKNALNRCVGLWNGRVYLPRCSRFCFNT